jgi:lysophospholipase L1-like esterase
VHVRVGFPLMTTVASDGPHRPRPGIQSCAAPKPSPNSTTTVSLSTPLRSLPKRACMRSYASNSAFPPTTPPTETPWSTVCHRCSGCQRKRSPAQRRHRKQGLDGIHSRSKRLGHRRLILLGSAANLEVLHFVHKKCNVSPRSDGPRATWLADWMVVGKLRVPRITRTKLALVSAAMLTCLTLASSPSRAGSSWVTSWVGSVQGPYPSGSPVAQPDQSLAIPSAAVGAQDQSMRMIVRPSIWGTQARIRFSNAFGSHPLVLDDLFIGVQSAGATLIRGSNRPLTFQGKRALTIAPGAEVWSDPVTLPRAVVRGGALLEGRKLAISLHVVGESGPMTWHSKGMQTSYLSPPSLGSHGAEEDEAAFPNSVNSWFFVDAVDMRVPAATQLVVCLGDSITDGTNSTLNGDDRWPDQLQRRFDAAGPNRVSVVNAGIGSNQIVGPADYPGEPAFGGGPSALDRLTRDVIELSGVKAVIWFEGINDLSHSVAAEDVIAGLRRGVALLRSKIPGVRVIGATITPALGAKGNAGTEEEDKKRRQVNDFIRTGGLYDGVADFEKAVIDPATAGLRPEMVFGTTVGGPGDKLHPNRAGYLAMSWEIDLNLVLPSFNAH